MITTRSVLSAILAWLAVVAVGSMMVWAVISGVGDDLAPSADPGLADSASGIASRSASPTSPPSSPLSPPSPSGTGGSSSAAPRRQTWQGPGGFITVECRGSDASLVARSADAGFTVEQNSLGPEEVKVGFEGQGDEDRETEVTARCVDGSPDFEVDASEG